MLVAVTASMPLIAFADLCSPPVSYSIQSIDPRFKITAADLKSDLLQAEDIWEKPSQKDLFVFASSSGDMRVFLVYDIRQQATEDAQATVKKLEAIKKAFDTIHARYVDIGNDIELQQKQNNAEFTAYFANFDQFNLDVRVLNEHGGASEVESKNFTDRKDVLTKRFAELKATQNSLNDRIRRFNILGDLLNTLTTALNIYVVKFNATFADSQAYEEGVYRQTGRDRTITMYEFVDSAHLIRALAHELGHALGLNHVADTDAIMYQSNLGSSTVATPADLTALSAVCRF